MQRLLILGFTLAMLLCPASAQITLSKAKEKPGVVSPAINKPSLRDGTAQKVPSSIHFAQSETELHQLKGEDQTAIFVFDVGKAAQVGVEQKLKFAVTSSDGEKWIKQINLIVDAPERFELDQNYPNPFN